MKRLILIVLFLVLAACTGSFSVQASFARASAPERSNREYTTYQIAAEATGCPEYILRGIAFAESTFRADAIGDDGMSIGRYQINDKYHEYYAEQYGEYNPFCPLESAILTGRIFMDNLLALGSIEDAIAAHRQGRTGVRNNGRTQWYVDRVLGYSEGEDKI